MSQVDMENLSDQLQSVSPHSSFSDSDPSAAGSHILVSVVMPCLNEARTLAACIEQAHAGCQAALARQHQAPLALYSGRRVGGEGPCAALTATRPAYEIIIADNGSSDGSPEIAAEHGARVIVVDQKGYGAALRGGIAAARGKYVVMADSDCSYDFGEVPRFLEKLEEGYDLVMGNRFAGEIKPGAMPWHHRYIGNPVLSGIGRLLFRTPCRDWHCGLRAFEREKIQKLGLKCTGMEFASEVVVHATQERLRIAEIPVILHPDGRSRAPHLRSMRDGFRHLRLILTCCSRKFFGFLAIVLVFTLAGSLALLSIGFGGQIFHVENPIRLSEALEVGRVCG